MDKKKTERHPQKKNRDGTPVRGGSSKKGGEGVGNWGVANVQYDVMRGGALDKRDPNYASSDDEMDSRSPDRPKMRHTKSTELRNNPKIEEPVPQFKRIGIDELFGSAPAEMTTTSATTSAKSSPAKGKNMSRKSVKDITSDQYAGGAHHNIPSVNELPIPNNLVTSGDSTRTPANTPMKKKNGRRSAEQKQQRKNVENVAHTQSQSTSTIQMEQSLKALLNITPAH